MPGAQGTDVTPIVVAFFATIVIAIVFDVIALTSIHKIQKKRWGSWYHLSCLTVVSFSIGTFFLWAGVLALTGLFSNGDQQEAGVVGLIIAAFFYFLAILGL